MAPVVLRYSGDLTSEFGNVILDHILPYVIHQSTSQAVEAQIAVWAGSRRTRWEGRTTDPPFPRRGPTPGHRLPAR